MRLWHYELLPFLPKLQFQGQLRELVAIMHDVRDRGGTNHILINRVMEYPKAALYGYFLCYAVEFEKRYGRRPKQTNEFVMFGNHNFVDKPFCGWHDKEYLKVCMANLYEKYRFGLGKTKITDKEWKRLLQGYKTITGKNYKL